MTTLDDQAQLIGALAHLAHPFERKQISKLPATGKRPELDYVNHAHVTARLNKYAPGWSYTIDESFTADGDFWVRGTMSMYGVSRVEYGQGKNPLEAVSHFIRRAGMRFGVALDLWAKEALEDVGSGGSLAATTAAPEPAPTGEAGEHTGKGDPASPNSLTEIYGTNAKALMAARKLFGDGITSLAQLELGQIAQLREGGS